MPKLILIDGPVASGKTTTCYALKDKLKDYAFVDREIIKRLLKHSGKQDAKVITDKTINFIVAELMKLNKNILIQEKNPKDLEKIIKKYGKKYQIYSFYLKCSLNEAIKRDRERGDNTEISIIKREYEFSPPKEKEIIIDTEKNNLNKTLKMILDSIK